MRPDAEEVGAGVAGEAVKPPVTIFPITIVVVAGFKRPVQRTRIIFHQRLKKQAGGARVAVTLEPLKIETNGNKAGWSPDFSSLSPAYAGGQRARMILRLIGRNFTSREIAGQKAAPNRGSMTFFEAASIFVERLLMPPDFPARPARGTLGVLCHYADTGPVDARKRIPLYTGEFAAVDIHEKDSRYRLPIERDARLAIKLPAQSEVVLLGSIATGKYVEILLAIFTGCDSRRSSLDEAT